MTERMPEFRMSVHIEIYFDFDYIGITYRQDRYPTEKEIISLEALLYAP